MEFEFSEQIGQGAEAPRPPAPTPRSSLSLAADGVTLQSAAPDTKSEVVLPVSHLEFAPGLGGTAGIPGEQVVAPAIHIPSFGLADSVGTLESTHLESARQQPPMAEAGDFPAADVAAPIGAPLPQPESADADDPTANEHASSTQPAQSPAARPAIFASLKKAGEAGSASIAPRSLLGGKPALGTPGLGGRPTGAPQPPGAVGAGGKPAIFAALAKMRGDAPDGSGEAEARAGETGDPHGAPALSLSPARAEQAPQRAEISRPMPPSPGAPAGGGMPPPGGGQRGGNGAGGGGGGRGGAPPGGGTGGGGAPPPGGGGGGGGGAAPPHGGIRIGDKLVEMGLISKDQLQVALYERKRTNKLIGTLLVELGFITESALSSVLASASGFERFDPAATVIEPELLKRFPKEVAQRYRVFPVSIEGSSLRLAMADIYDVLALDQAHRFVPPGVEIIPLVSSEAEILQAIDQYYGYEFSIDGIMRELETGKHDTSTQALSGDGYVHPLVRLVNAVLLDAVKNGASDIHFEPEGNFLRLRYRIDGVMQQVRTFQKDLWPSISHRLKIVSGMNIADKLNPQDGRFGFTVGSHRIDFRVAALPTVHGENIVIRILDKSRAITSMQHLGFSDSNMRLLDRMLKRPEGIIIVTGPTGSGKTTTLYAVLNHVSSLERNIMTLEDPVEYELPLIRQAQVREGTGMNFSDGVRAMLRQDPDIIFIGEVRDQATATMALRAAMTGHQVYSTLHTNDAASAIPRLHDLGLEHGLLAGNIIGIIAQRLVRRVCTTCGTWRPATDEECRVFGVDPADPPTVAQPVGCDDCRNTGYRGRIAVHEILPINREIDEMILSGASLAQVRSEARRHGYIPIADDGIAKILSGMLTLDSLMRSVDITDRL